MIEPIFVAQTAEPKTAEERLDWASKTNAEAVAQGVGHARLTLDEETGAVLYEGWASRPDEEGPPRFSFQKAV